jgi:hypothetical protein
VKALRLLFVFAASVPERVAAAGLATESAALPVVKSIGSLGILFIRMFNAKSNQFQHRRKKAGKARYGGTNK